MMIPLGAECSSGGKRQPAARKRRAGPCVLAAMLLATAGTDAASDDFRDISVIVGSVNRVLETERTGVPTRWSNSETGNHGTVTVTRTYYRADGVPCREYLRTTENPGGTGIRIAGVGCRSGPGVWDLGEDKPASASAAPSATPGLSEPIPDVARPPESSAPTATSGSRSVTSQRPSLSPAESAKKEQKGEPPRLETKEKPTPSANKAAPAPPPPTSISASLPAKSQE
jgi:surface antigen